MRTVRTTLISGAVAAAVLLVPLTGTFAQEGSMADHPVVGTWIVDADPANPGTNLHTSIFHADGTMSDSSPGSTGMGVWAPTGDNTLDVSFVEIVAGDDGREATLSINTSLEVSPDGQSWSGMNSVHFSPATSIVTARPARAGLFLVAAAANQSATRPPTTLSAVSLRDRRPSIAAMKLANGEGDAASYPRGPEEARSFSAAPRSRRPKG